MTERQLREKEIRGEWEWQETYHGIWCYVYQYFNTVTGKWIVLWKQDGRHDYSYQKFSAQRWADEFFENKSIELDRLEEMVATDEEWCGTGIRKIRR